MVTTRARHSAVKAKSIKQPESSPDPQALEHPDLSSLGVHDTTAKNQAEATRSSSRLRKKRQNGLSPIDKKPSFSSRVATGKNSLTPKATRAQGLLSSPGTLEGSPYHLFPLIDHEDYPEVVDRFLPLSQSHALEGDPDNNSAFPEPNANAAAGLAVEAQSSENLPQPQTSERPSWQAPPITAEDAGAIASIIEHGEAIERRYAEIGQVELDCVEHGSGAQKLKLRSLPILDNLATQVLSTLAQASYDEILTMITQTKSEVGILTGDTYAMLKSLFDHTKRVYSIQDPFLSAYHLGLAEPGHIDSVRKANMATFVSSVFGSQDVGFYYLNEYFLETFVPEGTHLLESQARLFLDLKTHAYISAVSNGECSREKLLEDLFPANLAERLLSRRPGTEELAPSEMQFIELARNRSAALLEEPQSEEAAANLLKKYVWEAFLKDVSEYVCKNFEAIVGKHSPTPLRRGRAISQYQTPSQLQLEERLGEMEEAWRRTYLRPSTEIADSHRDQMMKDTDAIAEKAAYAAHFAMQNLYLDPETTESQNPPQSPAQFLPYQPRTPQYEFEQQHMNGNYYPHDQHQQALGMQYSTAQQPINLNGSHEPYVNHHVNPYPTECAPAQSAPTQVLYERARMAATSKASPNSRRTGHPSQRRAWTQEEENALMAGLDRVRGPHWSQILGMFGPGGSISEALKDRNQVQLKDKARNLKLYFLKSGVEVPCCLSFVTGELKTRAPAQAAKNEAKKRERLSEDLAHAEDVATPARVSPHEVESAAGSAENGRTKGFVNVDGNEIDNVDIAERHTTEVGTPMEGVTDHTPREVHMLSPSILQAGANRQLSNSQSIQIETLESCLAEASRAGIDEVTRLKGYTGALHL